MLWTEYVGDMKHHPLCYNNVDDPCQLCEVIEYIQYAMIPECTCGLGKEEKAMNHLVSCRYAAYMVGVGYE